MGIEALAYPFLFIALFFESFVLVTFLSEPARATRARARARSARGADADAAAPTVAVIVPCWNEAATVGATCDSLLALEYPKEKLEVILVDDGSTDATPEAMARFAGHSQVRILRKENGGKHTALNAGIALSDAELIGCLDADSFVEPDALREIVACFADPRVAAATAAMSAHKPKNVLQHMQDAEYSFGIAMRHAMASLNGLYVTPGPFSFYRRSVIEELGGFRYGHQTEDMEMALRIQRAGYAIENAQSARVYTKTPSTLNGLIKQRTRWTSGFLRNILREYRMLVGNRRYGTLGLLVLPTALVSIMSGILLFVLMLFLSARSALAAISVRSGIPFSYAFLPHGGGFDWFYFPANAYASLATIVIAASVALILAGKRVSNTPGKILPGILSYLCLYAFVAPLWLIRATGDVAFGRRRGWRY